MKRLSETRKGVMEFVWREKIRRFSDVIFIDQFIEHFFLLRVLSLLHLNFPLTNMSIQLPFYVSHFSFINGELNKIENKSKSAKQNIMMRLSLHIFLFYINFPEQTREQMIMSSCSDGSCGTRKIKMFIYCTSTTRISV